MAIRTRQQANGRMIGFGRIMGVMVGTVAIGAAVVAGGLGWQSARTPQTLVNIQPMQQHALGIDLPQGADAAQLPRGLADYIRPGNSAQTVRFQATSLGINLPAGANLRDLPTGLTDYVRPQPAELAGAAPSAVLGITLPNGTQYTDLPRGVTDYLRANP